MWLRWRKRRCVLLPAGQRGINSMDDGEEVFFLATDGPIYASGCNFLGGFGWGWNLVESEKYRLILFNNHKI